MADGDIAARVERIDRKADALGVLEHRRYIEFSCDRLERRISEGLTRLDGQTTEGFRDWTRD